MYVPYSISCDVSAFTRVYMSMCEITRTCVYRYKYTYISFGVGGVFDRVCVYKISTLRSSIYVTIYMRECEPSIK